MIKEIGYRKLAVSGALLIIFWSVFFFFHAGVQEIRIVHLPSHSAIEAMGAVIALITAYILLATSKKRTQKTLCVSSALLGMGTLDLFHSLVDVGENFVWLHSTAMLVGGFLFGLICLPERFFVSKAAARLPELSFFGAVLLGLFSLVNPGIVPLMVTSCGYFSTTAKVINLLGGFFFLAAFQHFFLQHFRHTNADASLFAHHCFLFGLAGIIFDFSRLWDLQWWFWHLIRLAAYLVALSFIYSLFREKDRALKNNEKVLKEAQRLAHVGSWERDLASNNEAWSDEQFRIFGYQPGECRATYDLFLKAIHVEDRERVVEHINQALFAEQPYDIVFRIVQPAKITKHLHAWGRVIRNEKGEPVKMIGTVQDITERVQVEADKVAHISFLENLESFNRILQQSENMKEALATALEALLKVFDCDQVWLLTPCDPSSQKWSVPLTATRSDCAAAIAQDEEFPMVPHIREIIENSLRTKRPVTYGLSDADFPVSDGLAQRYSIQALTAVSLRPKLGATWLLGMHRCSQPNIWDAQDMKLFVEISHMLTDALSNLLYYNNISEREQRFRTIVSSIPGVTYRCACDADWTIEYISDEIETVCGYPASDFTEKKRTYASIIHPEDRQMVEDIVMRQVERGEPYKLEYRVTRKDGGVTWIHERGRGTYDARGNVLWLDGVNLDVSKEKQIRSDLEKKEEQVSLLLASTGEAIYGIDLHGRCTFCNPACISILGYSSAKELLGQNMHGLIHHSKTDGTPYPEKECKIFLAFRGEKGVHIEDEYFWKKDGSSFPVEYWSYPIRSKGEVTGSVVTFVDITKRKKMQQALVESEERFRQITESANDAVISIDEKAIVQQWNRAAELMFGYSAHEAIGRPLPLIIEEDFRKQHEEPICLGVEDGGAKVVDTMYESVARKRDGSKFPVEISLAKWFEGGRVFYTGIVRDISDRKLFEKKLQEYADTQGALLREVNHRVKNNLTSIISMLHKEIDRADQLVDGISPISPTLKEFEKRIVSLVTVHSMLSDTHWQPLLLSDICKTIIMSVFHGIHINLRRTTSPILIGSNQAHFLALVINEIATNIVKHAKRNGGDLEVDILISQKNNLVSIQFHDNGPGFSDDPVGGEVRGNTVGYDLIHGIVTRSLGGEVRVENDNGALVTVTFVLEVQNAEKQI